MLNTSLIFSLIRVTWFFCILGINHQNSSNLVWQLYVWLKSIHVSLIFNFSNDRYARRRCKDWNEISLIWNILCFLAPFKPLSPYVSCNPNYERCPGEEVCIPLSKFCDNKKDCYLGGDETSCNGKAFFCSCWFFVCAKYTEYLLLDC